MLEYLGMCIEMSEHDAQQLRHIADQFPSDSIERAAFEKRIRYHDLQTKYSSFLGDLIAEGKHELNKHFKGATIV